jgi:predicted phosphoribosyltransferase
MPSRFRNRREAGRLLARLLLPYADDPDVLVLALPRGGVPVGYEVATRLGAPLDVFVVRKLGVPGHEEVGMGAIASGGVKVIDRELVDRLRIGEDALEAIVRDEERELGRREELYRGDLPPVDARGRTVVLIDDGLATGSTMRAAVAALNAQGPKSIVVAVPISDPSTCEELRDRVDDIVCAVTPEPFYAVGLWYEDFSQTSDDEVRELLEHARAQSQRDGGARRRARRGSHTTDRR